VRQHWRGIGVTLFINWAIKPFSMALLGWLFVGWLFRDFLPAAQIDSYIAGLILLAAAPCTAMVFVWSHLVEGEPFFTLSRLRSTTRLWLWPSHRLSAYCLAYPRSPYLGTH
jgi:ACR3 family arsenite transporter